MIIVTITVKGSDVVNAPVLEVEAIANPCTPLGDLALGATEYAKKPREGHDTDPKATL